MHNIVNVLNATKLFTLKWLILLQFFFKKNTDIILFKVSSQKLYRLNTNPISPMGKVSLEKPRDLVKVTQILDLKLGPG